MFFPKIVKTEKVVKLKYKISLTTQAGKMGSYVWVLNLGTRQFHIFKNNQRKYFNSGEIKLEN
jgi:hypothetical protein